MMMTIFKYSYNDDNNDDDDDLFNIPIIKSNSCFPGAHCQSTLGPWDGRQYDKDDKDDDLLGDDDDFLGDDDDHLDNDDGRKYDKDDEDEDRLDESEWICE